MKQPSFVVCILETGDSKGHIEVYVCANVCHHDDNTAVVFNVSMFVICSDPIEKKNVCDWWAWNEEGN